MSDIYAPSFVDDCRQMRKWQKQFFATTRGSTKHKKALDMARYYEIRIDRALENMEIGQSELFASEDADKR